jgi:adenosylcobinamide kinase/adenosylcobinamide-phosphate guanylyltransferase
MTHSHIFISGGAYSGKTSHAVATASKFKHVTWIGTANEAVPEIKSHIKLIRSQRPTHWNHQSAPIELPEILRRHMAASNSEVVVIDSVSQWLANLIAQGSAKYDEGQMRGVLDRETDALLRTLTDASRHQSLITVSADFGPSLPPDDPSQRLLRQYNGSLNQGLARLSARAEYIFAGMVTFAK